MDFATIEQAIEDIKNGKMLVVVDDEDRENEGDVIVAAEKLTPEHMNFMATHAKGLICTPIIGSRLDELQIGQMVENNTDNHETAFTVSVDAYDTTTGISAFERCRTVRLLIDPAAKLPAAHRRGRRAAPRGPHGGDDRPRAARGALPRGTLLRDHGGRRAYDAHAAAQGVCKKTRAQHYHD